MDSQDSGLRSLLVRLRDWLFPRPKVQNDPTPIEPDMPSAPDSETNQLLTNLFLRLRRSGFNLGVPELLAAQSALAGGWGADDLTELAEVARLLWCKSQQERVEFDIFWEIMAPSATGGKRAGAEEKPSTKPAPKSNEEEQQPPPKPETETKPASLSTNSPTPTPLPLRTPYVPADVESRGDTISTYWPLSRRSMVYAWRYLRRPLPDGPADLLDMQATVAQVAKQGFYLAPIYRRRQRNHAHLILLVDQGGSMAPLHRFTRDLVESAQTESNLQSVETYYFHNVPGESYYRDPHLTQRIPAEQVLQQCTADSSVLIISDAGAARGQRYMERVRASARFLAGLKARTQLIAWLNPMPYARWKNSSAQFIAGMVAMYPMDPDGLSNAIDLLRGQP